MTDVTKCDQHSEMHRKYLFIIYTSIDDVGCITQRRVSGYSYAHKDLIACLGNHSIHKIPFKNIIFYKMFSNCRQMNKYQKRLNAFFHIVETAAGQWYLALNSTSPEELTKQLTNAIYYKKDQTIREEAKGESM